MNNAKLIKSVRAVDRLMKIIQGFMVAGIIISAIFVPLTLIFGEKVIASSDNPVLGQITLQLVDGSYLNDSAINSAILMILVFAIVSCVIGYYGIKILRSILLPMKEGRPFEAGISLKIKKLAWVALIGGTACEVIKAVAEICELRMYDLSMVFNSDVVQSYTFNASINGNFIVLAIVLFVLSYVFQYGEELQKESDETL